MSGRGAFAAGLALAAVACTGFLAWTRMWYFTEPLGLTGPLLLPPAARFPFRSGEELEYEFGVNGVAAAALHVSISAGREHGRDYHVMTYRFETTPAIARLWSYQGTGRALMDFRTLLPVLSERSSTDDEREKRTTTRFDREAGVARIEVRRSHKAKIKRREVACEGVGDIGSAFLLLRATDLTPGTSVRLGVLNGDDLYELTATPVREQSIKSRAGTFDAIEIELRVREIEDGESQGGAPRPRYRRARLWLSKGSRIPLRMEADILVGQTYAELVSLRTGRGDD